MKDNHKIILWNKAIASYVHDGLFSRAKQTFDRMPHHDLVSLNTLCKAYIQDGQLEAAELLFYGPMNNHHDLVSWNTLLAGYARGGLLHEASQVFETMPRRDIISWKTISRAYAHIGDLDTSIGTISRMALWDVSVWTGVITIFGHVGELCRAKETFDRMSCRDVLCWTAMLSAYTINRHLLQAEEMLLRCPFWDGALVTVMVTAYSDAGEFEIARSLFLKMNGRDVLSWTAVAVTYALEGHVCASERVLSLMPAWSLVSWNALINSCSKVGRTDVAKSLFDRMPNRDAAAWNGLMAACIKAGEVLAELVLRRAPQHNVIMSTSLLQANADLGRREVAEEVYNEMEVKDSLSTVTLMTAHAHGGDVASVKRLFDGSCSRDVTLWNLLISGYVRSGHLGQAELTLKRKMPMHSVVSYNTLLTAYAHASSEVTELFHTQPERNSVSWTILISSLARMGDVHQTELAFDKMPLHNVTVANSVCQVNSPTGRARELFNAIPCREHSSWKVLLESTSLNRDVSEAKLVFDTMPGWDTVCWSILLTAYADSGLLHQAEKLFNGIPERDVAVYNIMFGMYTRNGCVNWCVSLLERMLLEGIPADETSFTCLLTGFSHAGKVAEGLAWFRDMRTDHGVEPGRQHFATVTDMISRSGEVGKVRKMVPSDDPVAVRSFLGGCRTQKDVECGCGVEIVEDDNGGIYTLLVNILGTTL